MDEFKEQLAEIFEVEPQEIDLTKKFEDYENWDSLAALSIISMADTEFDKSVNRAKLLEFANLGDFFNFLKA